LELPFLQTKYKENSLDLLQLKKWGEGVLFFFILNSDEREVYNRVTGPNY
jgi:hypothetical protein